MLRARLQTNVIIAIMQPYFFPYIGYFQLMHAVDTFVLYDDAQYMKGGWINRNRILKNGQARWLTLPIRRADVTLPINQRNFLLHAGVDAIKHNLHIAYAAAPTFTETFPFICELLDCADDNVATFNRNLLVALAAKLHIACRFVLSSSIEKEINLKGQDRVIDICHQIGAERYINPMGGTKLYDSSAFYEAGLELQFLQSNPTSYPQFDKPPQSFLSIIDVLMFNTIERVRKMLDDYRVVTLERD